MRSGTFQNRWIEPLSKIQRVGKSSPLRGEGKGGGEKAIEMPFLPLTLTLSPKGRGEITFNNTPLFQRRFIHGSG
jgi:hypothetical protein